MYEITLVTILFLLFGVAVGTFSGLLPGIGATVSLLSLYPFLIHVEPMNIIIFYIALLSTSQYMGSVSSTVLAIPGELSSLPAVTEGHNLYLQGKGAYAISGTAIGSWVGSFFSVIFVLFISSYLVNFVFFYSTIFQSVLLLSVCALFIVTGHNRWYINALLCAVGYFLGAIGTHSITQQSFLVFGIPELIQGLPLFPILITLYIIPEIVKGFNKQHYNNVDFSYQSQPMMSHIKVALNNFGSILRGSFIGFFAGLIPYLTTIVASNLSYSIEVWLEKRKNTYSVGNLPSLISSETANNAAALSSLLPLLLLGLPITSSEAILSNILSYSGHFFMLESFTGLFISIAICLVIINSLALILSWPIVKYFRFFYKIDMKSLYTFIIALLFSLMIYNGLYNERVIYYILITVTMAPLSFILRKTNTMPLIFVFMMQNEIESNLFRLPYLLF